VESKFQNKNSAGADRLKKPFFSTTLRYIHVISYYLTMQSP
jgi:hypothetical protein